MNVSAINIEVKHKVRGRRKKAPTDLTGQILELLWQRGRLFYRDLAEHWPADFKNGAWPVEVRDYESDPLQPGYGMSPRGFSAFFDVLRKIGRKNRWRAPMFRLEPRFNPNPTK